MVRNIEKRGRKSLIGSFAVVALLALLTGCMTRPGWFAASSAPIPPKGYTVLAKKPVTGTHKQIWLLGFGGSLSPQQPKALADAMRDAPDGTDALVSVSFEEHFFTFLLYSSRTTSVTGIPVKFNP